MVKRVSVHEKKKEKIKQVDTLPGILFYPVIIAFMALTIFVIVTPQLSNEKVNSAIFGSFDSTGAAIILIGFPYLFLQYLEHHYRYYSL